MRRYVLPGLLVVLGTAVVVWLLMVREDSQCVQSNSDVAPLKIPLSERFTKALSRIETAALEKDTRPAYSLRIVDVARDSQAAQQGLQIGDLIAKVNGQPVRGTVALNEQRSGKGDTQTIWSPQKGLREIRASGRLGIWYLEHWLPELDYIRSAERSTKWDKMVLVAAQQFQQDPEVALYSIQEAGKVGYRGWLKPALSLCSYSCSGEHEKAAALAGEVRASVPLEAARPVFAALYTSLLLSGRIQEAAALAEEHGSYHLADANWDDEPLNKRLKSLSVADRKLIDAQGKLIKKVTTDHTKALQAWDENAGIILGYLKDHPDFGFNPPANQFSVANFGPFTRSAEFGVTFKMSPVQKRDPKAIYGFTVAFIDSSDGTGVRLLELTALVNGPLKLACHGYPTQELTAGDLVSSGDNRIELCMIGPWFEAWLNGRRVGFGLAPNQKRELTPQIAATGTQCIFREIVYRELAGDDATTQAIVTATTAGSPVVPALPTDPTQQWFYRIFVSDYLKHGKRGAAWDQSAVDALALAARWYNRDATADQSIIFSLCNTALENGCDDPLVLFVYADLFAVVQQANSETARRAYKKAAELLGKRGYHPLLQYAILCECARGENYSGIEPVKERAQARTRAAFALLPEILKDKEAPAWMVQRTIMFRIPYSWLEGTTRKKEFDRLYAAIEKAAPGSSLALTVKGDFYITYAWDARGCDWARNVTDQGWKLFDERLNIAEAALKSAWQMDQTNSGAMDRLITIAMARHDAEYDADTCFVNAIRADPANYEAYRKRLYALERRWGGIPGAMYAFAVRWFERVASNPAMDADIARILLQAHENLADDERVAGDNNFESATLVTQYWLRPEVWPDVSRVYELILKRAPSNYVKSQYASAAVRCEKWDVANKLLDELGPQVAPGPFGGTVALRQAKTSAKRHVAQLAPVSAPGR
ncbi:MAG TPA: hypothetical protein VGP72_31505 [Planctomycetota bacterium]|jgi:hypothetical protein